MNEYQHLTHEFQPICHKGSQILILGTFPSVRSREQHFYYGHPRNRFWNVLAAITNRPVPTDIPQKKQFLEDCRIAVWDVIQSCEIVGSSDSSIRNVVPADIASLLAQAPIKAIFGNGSKACELYGKYANTSRPIHKLPSTSPANAAWSLERLCEAWGAAILPFLS